MGRIRRKFEADFKRRIVSDIENKVTTLTAAAREHGISPTVIKYWQKATLRVSIPSDPCELFPQLVLNERSSI